MHLRCPIKKTNKWLKTDFSARGKNYYLTISLMKTEVKYQPAPDKQRAEPSITLSRTEQNSLTDATCLSCFTALRAGTFSHKSLSDKDQDRNPVGHSLSRSKCSLLDSHRQQELRRAPLLTCVLQAGVAFQHLLSPAGSSQHLQSQLAFSGPTSQSSA